MPILSRRRQFQPRACFDPAAGAGGGVTTADIIALFGADIIGIWDADLGKSLSGSDVISWTDQGSHGYVLGLNALGTASPPVSPIFSATSYGGKPGIAFSGSGATGKYLATTAGAVAFNSNACSFFAAATLASSAGAFGRLVSFDDNVAADWNTPGSIAAISRDSSNPGISVTQNTVSAAPYSISYDTPSRLGLVCDNTNMIQYLNNVAQNTTAHGFTLAAAGRISIGEGQNAGTNWDGKLRRLLILKVAASLSNRATVDTWLQG
jgi:hypothetical protein